MQNLEKTKHSVIIIGSGPAGMSAAIYLKRAGINPIIIEKNSPGGTLNKIHKIDNYPGYVDKDGSTLAFRMYSQIEELGIELKIEEVINIEKENEYFRIITNKEEYLSNYIIIATGKIPKKLNAIDANKYEGKGISYCAVCDGILYKNQDIAVIGGGNSAMAAVNYMSDIANKIYVINRSLSLRASEKEQEILQNKNVQVYYNCKVKEIIGDDEKLTSIRLDSDETINVTGVFVCIGLASNSAYYQNLGLETDNFGIIVNSEMKTSVSNIYACGDSISKSLYQVVNATSEGAIAAFSIINRIKDR